MSYEAIIYEKKDQIVHITLNRPEKLNAYSLQMMNELVDAWKTFGEDRDAHIAILTGAGRSFCVGLDIREREPTIPDISDFLAYTPKKAGVYKPVISAINGSCVGGGLRFLIESDLQICSEEAFFMDAHTSVGTTAEREMLALSRRIGYNHALRMGLMGRHERISGQQALALGLVSEVVPQENLLPRALELAETIRKNAPLALEASVELMWKSQSMGLEQAVGLADQFLRWNSMTEDFQEGPRAFGEKREPKWKGY
jgi:enoyl-CoA hydratase/carnithine racemase